MKRTYYILIILLLITSCSQKTVPFGLKRTINQMEKNLNDTIKYDFRVAPERVAGTKHHFGLGLGLRNGKGLWRASTLRTYFRLNGIKHPDDMSGIILKTLHRKLNNKPIKFKEQKRYYKEYWRIAQIEGDTLQKWRSANNSKIESDSLNQIYFSNFKNGRKVLGSVGAWTPMKNGHSAGTQVKMIREIVEGNDGTLKVKITELGTYKDKFILTYAIADTIETSHYDVYLIPQE